MFSNACRTRRYINKETLKQPLVHRTTPVIMVERVAVYAPYVAEMVRSAMYAQFGEAAYTSGFNVYTTINSKLQIDADNALRSGLIAYDQRHGYRGPEKNLGKLPSNVSDWTDELQQIPVLNQLQPAAVIQVNTDSAEALLADGKEILIPWSGLSWAKRYIDNHYVGAAPKQASDVVKVGDVIRVIPDTNNQWEMAEIPKVEGAVVALNPNSGAVLALDGGFSFQDSSYNRVIQALRQPGSNFKPFYYSAALEKGFTLASTINDAPL